LPSCNNAVAAPLWKTAYLIDPDGLEVAFEQYLIDTPAWRNLSQESTP